VLVVAFGPLAAEALRAAQILHDEGVSASVVDPRWLRPLSPELVLAAADHRVVVTDEDNAVEGGLGDDLARALRAVGASTRVRSLGLGTRFVPAGSRPDLLHAHGLD